MARSTRSTALPRSLAALSTAAAFTALGVASAVLAGLYPVAVMFAAMLAGEAAWAAKLIRRDTRRPR